MFCRKVMEVVIHAERRRSGYGCGGQFDLFYLVGNLNFIRVVKLQFEGKPQSSFLKSESLLRYITSNNLKQFKMYRNGRDEVGRSKADALRK